MRTAPVLPLVALLAGVAAAQRTERASVSSSGVGGNGDSGSIGVAISADGRFVAFSTTATNLVPQHVAGLVIRDLAADTTELASVDSSGNPGGSGGDQPSLSADGRFVAFTSISMNLVPNDTNACSDVFVHDRRTGATERVSVTSGGAQADRYSQDPSISADGRYVAFRSWATNLVPGDTNACEDIFVKDRRTGAVERVSVDSQGGQSNDVSLFPAISADGRFVAFYSFASNLVPGDTNQVCDVFVHDRETGITEIVSVASNGTLGNDRSGYWYGDAPPSISADGRFVAFYSRASNLVPGDVPGTVDTFVHDRRTGTTERVGRLGYPTALSADGRFVAFGSWARDVVRHDSNGVADAFVSDRLLGTTERVSVSTSGEQGDGATEVGPAYGFGISADGRRAVFVSRAGNLVPGDHNGFDDVFVRDRGDAASFAGLCSGDGSAGICPCGNAGAHGHGCENSAASGGARLEGSGTASLASDTAVLACTGEPNDAISMLVAGNVALDPFRFGDGLRCAGGRISRLESRRAQGGVLVVPRAGEPSLSERSAAAGDRIELGATRIYQVLYRDPDPSFCPPPRGGSFNVSNAVAIVWGP